MSRGRRVFAALAVLLAVTMLAPLPDVGAAQLEREDVVLISETGRHVIDAEIADTPGARATGLMFRRSLGADKGMLFIYDTPQNITMWMKNTYIPLDMIFADQSGKILRIARDTEPFSLDTIPAGGPAKVVLEVPGGTASRLKLRRGDMLVHPSVAGE